VFLVNVPLAVACLVLGALRLPAGVRRPRTGDEHSRGSRIDVPGMVLFALALTGLVLLVMDPSPTTFAVAPVALLLGALFVRRELRTDAPFLDLRVLAGNGPLLATYARNVLTFTVAYGFVYGFTQWLEDGRGLHPGGAGLVLLPMFLVAVGVSTLTGRHPEVRGKLLVGSAVQVVACAGLLLLDDVSPVWLLVLVTVVVGVPQGLNSLANQNALYHQAEPARMGSSAGLLRTSTYLGAIASAAAVAAFFPDGADTPGLHRLAWFMLGAAVVLLAVSAVDRSLGRIGAVGESGTHVEPTRG
jgi:hypothetical protein